MRFWYVLLIISVLIGAEILRAYWGVENQRPAWSRWINISAAFLLAVFAFILVQRVIFVLNTY